MRSMKTLTKKMGNSQKGVAWARGLALAFGLLSAAGLTGGYMGVFSGQDAQGAMALWGMEMWVGLALLLLYLSVRSWQGRQPVQSDGHLLAVNWTAFGLGFLAQWFAASVLAWSVVYMDGQPVAEGFIRRLEAFWILGTAAGALIALYGAYRLWQRQALAYGTVLMGLGLAVSVLAHRRSMMLVGDWQQIPAVVLWPFVICLALALFHSWYLQVALPALEKLR